MGIKYWWRQKRFFMSAMLLHVVVFLLVLLNFSWQHDVDKSNSGEMRRAKLTTYLYKEEKPAQKIAAAVIMHVTKDARNFKPTHNMVKTSQNIESSMKNDVVAALPASVSDGQDVDKLAQLLHDLLQQNIHYPRGIEPLLAASLKKHQVQLGFMLYSTGQVTNIEVRQSSGMVVLDNTAVAAVEKLPELLVADAVAKNIALSLKNKKFFEVTLIFK